MPRYSPAKRDLTLDCVDETIYKLDSIHFFRKVLKRLETTTGVIVFILDILNEIRSLLALFKNTTLLLGRNGIILSTNTNAGGVNGGRDGESGRGDEPGGKIKLHCDEMIYVVGLEEEFIVVSWKIEDYEQSSRLGDRAVVVFFDKPLKVVSRLFRAPQ